jgi:hypothetical protein
VSRRAAGGSRCAAAAAQDGSSRGVLPARGRSSSRDSGVLAGTPPGTDRLPLEGTPRVPGTQACSARKLPTSSRRDSRYISRYAGIAMRAESTTIDPKR